MSKKIIYAIIRIKTGKLICENMRLPIFWYKKEADHRAKDFIGCKVVRIKETDLTSLIPTTNDTE
jgi:hypothetical protein